MQTTTLQLDLDLVATDLDVFTLYKFRRFARLIVISVQVIFVHTIHKCVYLNLF